MGVDGQRRVVVDSPGREREVLESTEATPGSNLQLTLDLDLQAVAELALEGKRGAVVALDPRNGEVLAMVSRPGLRSQRVRDAHHERVLEGADVGQRQSDAESRDSGAVRAGLDVQADHGAGRPRNRHDRRALYFPLPRRSNFLRALFQVLVRNAATDTVDRAPAASSNPATFSFTTWATSWASTRSPSMRRWRASARRPASICRAKPKA